VNLTSGLSTSENGLLSPVVRPPPFRAAQRYPFLMRLVWTRSVILLATLSIDCERSGAASRAPAHSFSALPTASANLSPATTIPPLPDAAPSTTLLPAMTSATSPSMSLAANATSTVRWDLRLAGFYWSYREGAAARAAACRKFFAPRVRQFIELRDASLDQVIRSVDTFFRNRANPMYDIEGRVEETPNPTGSIVHARVAATWDEICPSQWADKNWTCQRQTRLDVRLEADPQGRVVAYEEKSAPKDRYRVVADDVSGFEQPHTECEDASKFTADVDLAKGTVVEATGRVVQSLCGQCETIRQFVYEGNPYWTTASTNCVRTAVSTGGIATSGESFLIRLQ